LRCVDVLVCNLLSNLNRMFLPRSYLVILFLSFVLPAIAQDDSTRGVTIVKEKKKELAGKAYALIIGISEYQHFPKLNYADKDAVAFQQFLLSKSGGSLDSSDIFIRLNAKARAGDIWSGISWLQRNADSAGEKAYIYFAGHGDAADASQAYLLANDACCAEDPNLYNAGGTFQVYNLKAAIKKMTARGVKVILITDACRTNDLPGKESGARWTFASITEERCGEIQMTSCAADEKSMESPKWGNGRGVFSYFLINGLYGLADNEPEDNEVTLYELERYVKDNVRKETRSLVDKKVKQNPVFCCNEFNEMSLAKIDSVTKALVIADINAGNPAHNYATRGELRFRDSVMQELYRQFLLAIKEERLVSPDQFPAENYLTKLLVNITDENIKNDLKDQFVAELLNFSQNIINRYTSPPREDSMTYQNSLFFRKGAEYLEAALKYLEQNPELKQEINAKKLFLEASAIAEYEDWYGTLAEGIAKADSSLRITHTGYTNNTLGMLYRQSSLYDSAKAHFIMAAKMAPKWTYPLLNLGNMYRDDLGQPDSALLYYRRCISINPNYKNAYYNIGIYHYQEEKFDSALYYFRNAVGLNASYANAYNYLGITFLGMKQYDSARVTLHKVIELDSNYEIGYYNLALAYYNLNQFDTAIRYSKKAIALYPTYSNAYLNLGLAYSSKAAYDSATKYYRLAIYHDANQYKAYYDIGYDFEERGMPDSALYYYNQCLRINSYCPAYKAKGFIYYRKSDLDVALFCFHQSLSCDPSDEYTHNAIGMIYTDHKTDDSAYLYFSNALKYNPDMEQANYNMGKYYYYRPDHHDDSALLYLRKAAALKYKVAHLYYLIGKIFYSRMADDSAIVYYKRSLEIDPAYTFALSDLAVIYEARKDFDKAIMYYKQLMELQASAPTAYSIAKLSAKKKNTKETLQYIGILLQMDKGYVYDIDYEAAFDYLRKDKDFLALLSQYRSK
jgi:tetratricopeptide (TPR) repeat protein